MIEWLKQTFKINTMNTGPEKSSLLTDIAGSTVEITQSPVRGAGIGSRAVSSEVTTPEPPDYEAIARQAQIEKGYSNNLEAGVTPLESHQQPDMPDLFTRFEHDHMVKIAPRLPDQALEADRTNPIAYVKSKVGLEARTSDAQYISNVVESTEQDVLQNTKEYLELAGTDNLAIPGGEERTLAASMRENLTFIGEKEFQEATAAWAQYWKMILEANPEMQIYAVAGEVAHTNKDYKNEDGSLQVKSDEYVLNAILKHFMKDLSDEEIGQFAGRLVLDPDEIKARDPKHLRTILVDDWTISGDQLSKVRRDLLRKSPDLYKTIEIQLLVADRQRALHGLRVRDSHPSSDIDGKRAVPVPVRAYYQAHAAQQSAQKLEGEAFIAGSHSVSDYNTEKVLAAISQMAHDSAFRPQNGRYPDPAAVARLSELPGIANIVRPYRKEGFELTEIMRFRRLTHLDNTAKY